ncbi:hypothetical protein ABFS83_07G082500 [Erythranthe nasuta]
MVFPIPTLVVQCVTAVYTPLKDTVLYLKGQRRDVKDLEVRLDELLNYRISIKSRKKQIDRELEDSATTEKSDEYKMMEQNLKNMDNMYAKFRAKYEKFTSNLPVEEPELDVVAASNITKELNDRKPRILTLNFLKLAELSRDINRLNKQYKDVLDRVKRDYMISKKNLEVVQQTLDHDNDLPGVKLYVDEVLSRLSVNGWRSVGITGPVGVGKTTVLTKLYNHVSYSKSLSSSSVGNNNNNLCLDLDTFVRMTYPQELEADEKIVDKLQKEIMVQLRINHDRTESKAVNGDRIFEFLCERKYIVFMDNVFKDINLDILGLRQGHKNGKVVIASSEKKFIGSIVDDVIEIKKLSNDDASKLFWNVCGDVSSTRKKEIADKIIECCGGLPGEIKLVAKYLKDKEDESLWNNLKRTLQSYTPNANLMGLGGFDKLYKEMYEKLEENYKKCFLYVALFPNEIYKDYLIECWVAENFIGVDKDHKLRCTRDEGRAFLTDLTDKYMLDCCSYDKRYVKMPPNIKRVFLEQKYPDEDTCLIWVSLNYEKPNTKIWETATRMSLIGCRSELPESPKCTNIYTLLLRSKPELEILPHDFFLHMQSLRVFDLHQTRITTLPTSVAFLTNLRSLNLTDCSHITMLPDEAAKLQKLEFLDICGTSIPSLPQEISSMCDLRCLRASSSSRACNQNSKVEDVHQLIIPLKVISKLKRLEELSIDACFHSQRLIDVANELAMEMAGLKYLTTLRFNFPNVKSLDTFVSNSESLKNKYTEWETHTLNSFKIFIGCQVTRHPYELDISEMCERRLRFSKKEQFSSHCNEVLKQASTFELISYDRVQSLNEFNLHSVQVCVVEGCHNLKNIVQESSIGTVLENMEKLYLFDLPSLNCIWEGPVLGQSLVRLTVLKLNSCPTITRLFDPKLASALPSLKHLAVENCAQLSQIVVVPDESNDIKEELDLSGILNKVETVELRNLPELHSICKSNSMEWSSLKAMVIVRCSKLSNLSLNETNARMLASIECEDVWWAPHELPDRVKQRLHPFCRIKNESTIHGVVQERETLSTPINDDSRPWETTRAQASSSSARPWETTRAQASSSSARPWETTRAQTTRAQASSSSARPWETTRAQASSSSTRPWETTRAQASSSSARPWETTCAQESSSSARSWEITRAQASSSSARPDGEIPICS